MKKILITIGRGWIARNLLHNDFYKILREKYKIVILTSAARDKRFIKEFNHPNVSFVYLEEKAQTWADLALFFFHKNLIYNSTIEQKNKWGIVCDPRSKHPSYASFLIKKAIFTPLSRLEFLRDFVRFLDKVFLQRDEVRMLVATLKRENPDIVISTNIASNTDSALLKAAHEMHILSIGYPKSWDNLSKHSFRAKTDFLVVWNEFMADEARQFQNYTDSQIKIIGIPQFDDYVNPERIWTRQRFCSEFKLDEKKKIIFFGSEGKLHPADKDIATILSDFVSDGSLAGSCQLFIRPHYGYKDELEKFRHLMGKANVVIDLYNNPSSGFKDSWDYSEYFTERFINSIFHSEVIINTYSTLTLDGIAFDKPVITINFDGRVIKKANEATERWGEVSYLRAMVDSKALSVASSEIELRSQIIDYLQDPSIKAREREEMRRRFCYKIDGQSGLRFAKIVEGLL